MSKVAQTNGDDYVDAASKHVKDARILLDQNRLDNAEYLAGYVVECTLKTIAVLEGINVRMYKHDINQIHSKLVRDIPSLASPKTAAYIRYPITNLQYGLPNGWEEVMRYRSPFVAKACAESWVIEAERLYRQIIQTMQKDGLI